MDVHKILSGPFDSGTDYREILHHKNFTPEMYHHLLTGGYPAISDSYEGLKRIAEVLGKDHPYNNEKNNKKAVETLLGKLRGDKDGEVSNRDAMDIYDNLGDVLSHFNTGSDAISSVIKHQDRHGTKDRAFSDIGNNPSLNSQHLREMVDENIDLKSLTGSRHPAVNKDFFNYFLDHRTPTSLEAGQIAAHPEADGELSKRILEDKKAPIASSDFDLFLSKLSEEDRHEYIRDALGMNGGKLAYEDEEGWDNWEHGAKYRRIREGAIASSEYLRPDEIEHIKRHGDFDSKYSLLHNVHIDPKHGLEMLKKWKDNDSHHGYDEKSLRDQFENDHENRIRDDVSEQANEDVQAQYPLSDYMSNYSQDEIANMAFDKSYDDWARDRIKDLHGDKVIPNPNYMPLFSEDEDNKREIKIADMDDDQLESLPEYDSWKDEVGEDFQQAALDATDQFYEGYDEYNRDSVYERERELINEKLDNWDDPENEILPDHLREHMETKALPQVGQVDVKIGSHPLRVLRDFVESNGGKIKKSTLKSMNVDPKPIEKLFRPDGHIHSEDIQKHIDSLPPVSYNSSHKTWSGAQRHSKDQQNVFQLNYTQDMAKEMEKAGVLKTFREIFKASKRSGHPVAATTLGWARYTGDHETGFHIDEVQSDFGQSLVKQAARQAKEAAQNGAISEEEANQAVERAKSRWPDDHLKKIQQIVFGGRHPSEMIHEGLKDHIRKHGHPDAHIHIWQPESKAVLSHQDLSVSVPTNEAQIMEHMSSAQKGDISTETKALILWGQKNKIVPGNLRDMKPDHWFHLGKGFIKYAQDNKALSSTGALELPLSLPVHMQEGYGKIPKAMKYSEGKYGELPTQNTESLKGKPTYKDIVRKSEGSSIKSKVAMTLKTIQDNSQLLQSLKEQNPESYQAIVEMTKALVEIFKRKTGEDPQALVHELEIKEQLQDQQAPQQEQSQDGQPQQGGSGRLPEKDQPIHNRQLVYAPGSVRRYSSQDERIKGDDGEWSSFGGGVEEPN